MDKSGAMVEGIRCHAKGRIHGWVFNEQTINLQPTNALLVRALIGKIERKDRAVDIIRKTPIKPGEPGWNCVIWARDYCVKHGLRSLWFWRNKIGFGFKSLIL